MIQNSMLSSQNVSVKSQLGCMQVVEYTKDEVYRVICGMGQKIK